MIFHETFVKMASKRDQKEAKVEEDLSEGPQEVNPDDLFEDLESLK
jgi:hypothetical protein